MSGVDWIIRHENTIHRLRIVKPHGGVLHHSAICPTFLSQQEISRNPGIFNIHLIFPQNIRQPRFGVNLRSRWIPLEQFRLRSLLDSTNLGRGKPGLEAK
jgi:hypothetical protein